MSKYAGNNTVQLQRPKRSQFDLSHYRRSTVKPGYLTPVFITECVPSDTFRGSSEILVRLAPMLAPVYDTLRMYVHYFFVPNRLLWDQWEEFITGGRLGVGVEPIIAPLPPMVDIGVVLGDFPGEVFAKGSLSDHLGVPIFESLPGYGGNAPYIGKRLDILPHLAYYRCYFDYYRDRNFVSDSVGHFPYPGGVLDFSDDTIFSAMTIKRRYYEHDYFTSALPFTQRGEEVLMPMAGTGTVNYMQISRVYDQDGDPMSVNTLMGSSSPNVNGDLVVNKASAAGAGTYGRIENIEDIDFQNQTVSINDFRSAYALQVWLERNAIGGSRYNESTQAHFGVRPQDSRLQRAEYIGGGVMPIKISEIVSTAYSNDGEAVVPLANLAGHGIAYGNTNQFNYFCTEHGFIIGIASIMAPPSYHQGLPKMFRRRTFLDYPWPTFAKLGEQHVDKAELFASAANLTENADGVLPLFGYQSRYADWKQIQSTNHGDFHDTLMFWTMTREFAASPTLGNNFLIFDSSTVDRVFAVQDSEVDKFWLYVNNQISVRRPLPYFGTPNTLGFV